MNLTYALVAICVLVLLLVFDRVRLRRLSRAVEEKSLKLKNTNERLVEALAEAQAARQEAEETSELVEQAMVVIQEHEQELVMARNAAQEANRAKSQFLASMSHELRTPLNAIIGYCELLQEEAQDREDHKYLEDLVKIKTAAHHLLMLINGILDLSKIEAGKMELYLETFDISSALNDVVTTVQPMIVKNNNRLTVQKQGTLGFMRADETRVRQILINLLSNAAKFTENGFVSLRISRERVDGADWVVFQVSDSGIGMTSDQLKKLFRPFAQADSSTSRKYGGTGLGLIITKRFCELMGGQIFVESHEGHGTTFTVRLPAEVPQLAEPSPLRN